MSAVDPYANIVQLYDLEHEAFSEDIDLLLQLADATDGPVLELGCGTGRVMFPLAEAGRSVVGIDASEPMLAVAKARAAALPHCDLNFIHGDMADLDAVSSGPFGMIIASLNSIMHLTTQEQQRQMIASAWRILAPGGRLVIDTLNPSVAQLNHLLNTTHLEGSWITASGESIDKWGHRRPGDEPQTIDTLIWYDQLNADGSIRRVRTRFDLRYLHQSELALLLEMGGFRHIDWYGSYELDEWYADSDRTIAIAYKDHE